MDTDKIKTKKFSEFQLLENLNQSGSSVTDDNRETVYLVGYKDKGATKPEVRVPIDDITEGKAEVYMFGCKCTRTPVDEQEYTYRFEEMPENVLDSIEDAIRNNKLVVCDLNTNIVPENKGVAGQTYTTIRMQLVSRLALHSYCFTGILYILNEPVFYTLELKEVNGMLNCSAWCHTLAGDESQGKIEWGDIENKPEYFNTKYDMVSDMPAIVPQHILLATVSGDNAVLQSNGLYKLNGTQWWAQITPTIQQGSNKTENVSINGAPIVECPTEISIHSDIQNYTNGTSIGAFGVVNDDKIEFYSSSQPDASKRYVFFVKMYCDTFKTYIEVIIPDEPGDDTEPIVEMFGASTNLANTPLTAIHKVPTTPPTGYTENTNESGTAYYVDSSIIINNGYQDGRLKVIIPNSFKINTFYVYDLGGIYTAVNPKRIVMTTENINGVVYKVYKYFSPEELDVWFGDKERYTGDFNSENIVLSFYVTSDTNNE